MKLKLLADATLPELNTYLNPTFTVITYKNQEELKYHINRCDVLLCRSTLKVDEKLLANSPIQCVATASSGIDHLDVSYLYQQKITWFDAKGSNASAVADYVMATIAWLDYYHAPFGKDVKIGVIGVGAVGASIMKRLLAAGFDVLGFDPLKVNHHPNLAVYAHKEILYQCDVLCVHANLHKTEPFPSYHLLDSPFLNALSKHTILINAARGNIIDEQALLECNSSLIYCTDVYANEPAISAPIINKATLCTPHIAGHSKEAKALAIKMISEKLHQYYGYTIPFTMNSSPSQLLLPDAKSWQETILALYNPEIETHALKKAHNKQQAFLTLRQAHQQRHSFSLYHATNACPFIQSLLCS